MGKLMTALLLVGILLFVFYAIIVWAVKLGVKQALRDLKEEGFFEGLDKK